jgi:putative RecB family exonuclease
MATTDLKISDVERLPSKLSPSRAKTFMQCPKRFYYETILGLVTPETLPTAKGTLAHHAFERIFDHGRAERTPENAVAYIRPAWDMMLNPIVERSTVTEGTIEWALRDANDCFRDKHEVGSKTESRLLTSATAYLNLFPADRPELVESFLAETESIVRSWFLMETPSKFDPMERELYVFSETAGTTLHGYIDRLDKTITKKGEERYWISDYKTGKPPAPRYADEAFFQLEVYALLVQAKFGVMPYQMRLIYVREGRPDAVLTRNVTPEILVKTKSKVKTVVDAINKSARTGKWEAKTHVLCGWCPFKPVCPAHNPDMEGLLPEEIARQTGTIASQR